MQKITKKNVSTINTKVAYPSPKKLRPITPVTIYDQIMTLDQVAKFLHVHPTTVYRLVKEKVIDGAFRVGSDWRFRRVDVDNWCTKQIKLYKGDDV